ncbi:MAG: hypothetical protein M3O36_06115, partial [Myxococcota bacterium]|nr:hypothetical protein [Myxococcota bacterium]
MVSFAGCVVCFLCLVTRVAGAAANDAAVQKLRDEAIYTDYLATNFAEAEKKLAQAADLCRSGPDCSAGIRARLSCDRGVVAFALQKPTEGRAFFVSALKEDPNVALDRDLTTTDIQREFAAVKAHPEGAPATGGQGAGDGGGVPGASSGEGPPT